MFKGDNKLAKPWFGHLGTNESNKRVIPCNSVHSEL